MTTPELPGEGEPETGTPAPESLASDRKLTVPNVITMARLSLVPFFAWAFASGERDVLALSLLVVIGSTDWVDGFVARKTGQVSELGKLLDPVADRVAIIVVLALCAFRGTVYWPLAAAILLRDVLVAATFAVVESKGVPRIPVSWMGKGATAAIYIGLGLALISLVAGPSTEEKVHLGSTAFLTVGAGAYWLAAFGYAGSIKNALKPKVNP